MVIPGGGAVVKIEVTDSKGIFELTGPAPLDSTKAAACGDAGCVYHHLDWSNYGATVVKGCATNESFCDVKVGPGSTQWTVVYVRQDNEAPTVYAIWNSGKTGYTLSGTITQKCSGGGCKSGPAAGISVTAGSNGFGTTDKKGEYSMIVPKGSYAVKPVASGSFMFSPTSRSVSVEKDTGGVDFAASEQLPLEVSVVAAKTELLVSKAVHVSVIVKAGPDPVTAITVPKGLESSKEATIITTPPDATTSFDLAADAQKTFQYTIKGTKAGTATLQATANGTGTSGAVEASAKATLKVTADAPEFDYTMPARYQESALTESYAQPDSYEVLFTVLGGECDRDASYDWFVDDKPVASHRTDPCVFAVDFDKLGTYSVRVEQGSDPTTKPISFTKEVVVQDFLVAAIGDSLASGEGNPPYSGACDRSKLAYPSLAAKRLEGADLRSSVTFLQLACSGANMAPISVRPGLVGGVQRFSSTPRETVYDQLLDLKSLVGDRKIDALTLSVGINDVKIQVAGLDVGFGRLVAICVAKSRCQNTCVSLADCVGKTKGNPFWTYMGISEDNLTIGDLMPEATDALSGLYDELGAAINEVFPPSQLDRADVYVVGYPDPLRNEAGELCPVLIPKGDGGAAGGFEDVDGEGEVTWFQQYFLSPLQHAEDRASSRFGWHYIDSNVSFATHGYCSTSSYFVHLGQLLAGKVNPSGVLHPNGAGQATIADSLYDQMADRLLPDGHARKPS